MGFFGRIKERVKSRVADLSDKVKSGYDSVKTSAVEFADKQLPTFSGIAAKYLADNAPKSVPQVYVPHKTILEKVTDDLASTAEKRRIPETIHPSLLYALDTVAAHDNPAYLKKAWGRCEEAGAYNEMDRDLTNVFVDTLYETLSDTDAKLDGTVKSKLKSLLSHKKGFRFKLAEDLEQKLTENQHSFIPIINAKEKGYEFDNVAYATIKLALKDRMKTLQIRQMTAEQGVEAWTQVADYIELIQDGSAEKIKMQQTAFLQLSEHSANLKTGSFQEYKLKLKRMYESCIRGIEKSSDSFIDAKATFVNKFKSVVQDLKKEMAECTDSIKRSQIYQRIKTFEDEILGYNSLRQAYASYR